MVASITLPNSDKFESFLRDALKTVPSSIIPLAGDVSSRKYYRVLEGQQSWVLMEWEPFTSPQTFPFISIQTYFKNNNIAVPEIFSYDESKGYFLLEDLGDLTLERKFWEFHNQENILPYYKSTLDELIKVHRLYLTEKNRDHCTAYKIEFDVDKFLWELNYTLKNLIQGLCGQSLSAQVEAQLQTEFKSIAERLAKLPQVICHRDFHSRNVMIKGDQTVLIDFQDARLGPPQYDLVSLIHDSYVQLNEQTSQNLINYYLDKFPEGLKLFKDKKEFMYFFQLQTLQRCFKACGTFSAVYQQRKDKRYLKYLPGTLGKVSATLTQFDEYPTLRKIMDSLQVPSTETLP